MCIRDRSNLTEFKLKDKDFEVLIRTEKYYKGGHQTFVSTPQMMSASQQHPSPSSVVMNPAFKKPEETSDSTSAEAPKGKNLVEIKSPIVGTFYRSSGPDKPCLLYTSDAADERSSVDLGGRRIIKKKKQQYSKNTAERKE